MNASSFLSDTQVIMGTPPRSGILWMYYRAKRGGKSIHTSHTFFYAMCKICFFFAIIAQTEQNVNYIFAKA